MLKAAEMLLRVLNGDTLRSAAAALDTRKSQANTRWLFYICEDIMSYATRDNHQMVALKDSWTDPSMSCMKTPRLQGTAAFRRTSASSLRSPRMKVRVGAEA